MNALHRPAPLVVLLFAAAVGLLGGMVWSVATPTTVTATATVFVSSQGVRAVDDLRQQAARDEQAGDSFASVATSSIVLEPVAARLGVGADDLARGVAIDRQPDTALLKVRATDASAERAATTANLIAERLVAVAPSLTPTTPGQTQALHLTQVQRATAGDAAPGSGLQTMLLGLLAGAGIGAVALLLRWLWQRRPPAGGGMAAPSLL